MADLFRARSGVVQIRVTPKTRNPFTIKALSISGVTWNWHVLNHAEPGISGAKPLAERPQGAALLSRMRPGDTLIVARLDRAFRNAADALATAERFKAQRM